MENEDENESRLTKNEFAELIQHLSLQEILSIEYRINANWSKLFSRKNISDHKFFCNLCALETSSFKSLLEHIDGRKHKLQMESVKQLYHPDYTYPKSDFQNHEDGNISDFPMSKNLNIPIDNEVEEIRITLGNNKSNLNTENDFLSKQTSRKCITGIALNKLDDCLKTPYIGKEIEMDKCDLPNENKHEEGNENSGIDAIADEKQNIKFKDNEMLNCKSISNESGKVVVEKRLACNDTEEIDVKKRKIVINPVKAFFLNKSYIKANEKKSENGDEKTKYHKYKVIKPSVEKSKLCDDKRLLRTTSEVISIDPPRFSVKSYNSNLSGNDIHGILGVEYVIKILKTHNDTSPRYECGLCELVLDGHAMQRHLQGYNHRMKFCEKHFPTAIRQYRQYIQNIPEADVFKVMDPVLAKLAKAIEEHHGRNLPYECYERDFSLNHHEILSKAFSCRHASEQYGPTFTHVVSSKEIDEFIKTRHMYIPPPFSPAAIFDSNYGNTSIKTINRQQKNESLSQDRRRHAGRANAPLEDYTYNSFMRYDLSGNKHPHTSTYKHADNRSTAHHVDNKVHSLMVDDFLKGTSKRFSSPNTLRYNFERSISPVQNLGPRESKPLTSICKNDIWEAYYHIVDQKLYDLNERFEKYKKYPETHPSYSEEWQKFWKRRKNELVSAGLDHHKYNFQPEWVRFVKIRMKEFYDQEVENIKLKSRKQLCLPLTNDHISNAKYHLQVPKVSLTKGSFETAHSTETTRSTQPAPSTSLYHSNNNLPQVVSVLRLMTALEDSLGSLGPKITQLLSKALQIEKTNPSAVNSIIYNNENWLLIATAKEKFKRLVITGLFEGSKKRVLSQVVNDAEALLQYAVQSEIHPRVGRSSVETLLDPTQINSSLFFDSASMHASNTIKAQPNEIAESNYINRKLQRSSTFITGSSLKRMSKKELASKLTASLLAQRRADFNPQPLQHLISLCKLTDKKKHENGGTLSSYEGGRLLQELTSKKKMLSDTLSDLLKSSSFAYAPSDVSKSSRSPYAEISVGSQFGNCISLNSSDLQSCNDSYKKKIVRSIPINSIGMDEEGRNQVKERSEYCMNYTGKLPLNQQNCHISNVYTNQYQYTTQNYGFNSNMEMNQYHDMDGPYKNISETSNWQNF